MRISFSEFKDKLIPVCNEYDIILLGLFGSFAKGEAKDGSDVDLVVRFSRPKSLLELVRIENGLSQILKRKVDLLTEASISPYLKDRIHEEMKIIYEKAG